MELDSAAPIDGAKAVQDTCHEELRLRGDHARIFLISMALHWLLERYAFLDEAKQHGEAPEVFAFLGLAYLLCLGSPASKENHDRTKLKIDALTCKAGLDLEIEKTASGHHRHSVHAKLHATPRQFQTTHAKKAPA